MGSHNFSRTVYSTEDHQTVYRRLVEDALHEHGHDGYNGTISTTSGATLASRSPMTLAQAEAFADKRHDYLNKWDNCEVVPLVKEVAPVYESTGTQEVTLDLPGESINDREKVIALLARSLKVKPDAIESFSIANDARHQRRATFETKVTAKATEGKTETRYFVLDPKSQHMPRWEDGFASQAEARASLPKAMRWGWDGTVPTVKREIISMTRRVSGEPLVKATVSVKKAQVTYTVTTRRLVSKGSTGTEHAGWYFYGWAAS